jgi:hypothetical protein
MTSPDTEPHSGEARRIPRAQPGDVSDRRLRRVERLAWLLDTSIPVGRWRIGLDPILGLIPGLGDWVGAVLSLYILYEGARLGLRGDVLARMTMNILIETVVGTVPVLGDLFDFGWRANVRNVALIRRYYRPDLKPRSLDWVVAAVGFVALAISALAALLGYLVVVAILALFNA